VIDTNQPMHLPTAPAEITVADATLSADIEHLSDGSWDVVVVLRHAPGPRLIDAGEVDAELMDADGRATAPLTRPHGKLPEAGGSLAVSANARFRFGPLNPNPTELIIHWRHQSARFLLRQAR
jgi:hypothetical protein